MTYRAPLHVAQGRIPMGARRAGAAAGRLERLCGIPHQAALNPIALTG